MDLFLAHSLGLLWISVVAARRLVAHPADRLLAAGLFAWGNLTTTRLLLGLVDRLDEPGWILGTSLFLAVIPLRPWSRSVPDAPAVTGPGTGLMVAVGLTLVPLAAFRLTPLYLEQPGDPELLNATSWLLAGLAIFRLGRLCDLGANSALVLSWAFLLASLVLAPHGSVALALPTLAGTLAGLVFARQWQRSRRLRHALLASLAALLVAGGLSGLLRPTLRWSGPPPSLDRPPPLAPDKQRLFAHDLIFDQNAGPVITTGLRPAEGPFPLRDLPRFRSVRQPALRLLIPPQPGLKRLQVRFSLGVLQRDKTEVLVRFNGQTVNSLRLTRRAGWLDETLDLPALSGENVIEFSDVLHQQELDWRGYLERYQDVRRHLVTYNIPLEEGALEHYEISGKPEGRRMSTREIPPPVHGAYYFVFRQLQVEGRR